MAQATESQRREILRAVVEAILEACKVAGPMGAPGGHLYAALMATGMRLEQFESIMRALVEAGKLEKRGHCYHFKA